MINIMDEKDCCGCGACSEICPKGCISMELGTLGHMFPVVEQNNCIGCGKCEKVCPMLMPLDTSERKTQVAYAAYAKDKKARFKGSSGGIFGVLASELLLHGYIIYGAAFDNDMKLKCARAENIEELQPLMKSKYLQSDLTRKYSEIKENLDNNKKVLFVSTPCQVTALKKYLGKHYENLITLDFFCHGVPSQKFFDECKQYIESKRNIKIVDFQFRSKRKNGSTPHYYSMKYMYKGKTYIEQKLYFKSAFYAAFQKYINLRESCYECRFAGKNRNADITIGDFHEIDNYVEGINRFDGISTVIINSYLGSHLWDLCKNKLNIIEVNLDQLEKDRVCFAGGTKRPTNRDEFIDDYKTKSFDFLVNKYMNPRSYWKWEIYYLLPKTIREKIKKCMGA